MTTKELLPFDYDSLNDNEFNVRKFQFEKKVKQKYMFEVQIDEIAKMSGQLLLDLAQCITYDDDRFRLAKELRPQIFGPFLMRYDTHVEFSNGRKVEISEIALQGSEALNMMYSLLLSADVITLKEFFTLAVNCSLRKEHASNTKGDRSESSWDDNGSLPSDNKNLSESDESSTLNYEFSGRHKSIKNKKVKASEVVKTVGSEENNAAQCKAIRPLKRTWKKQSKHPFGKKEESGAESDDDSITQKKYPRQQGKCKFSRREDIRFFMHCNKKKNTNY